MAEGKRSEQEQHSATEVPFSHFVSWVEQKRYCIPEQKALEELMVVSKQENRQGVLVLARGSGGLGQLLCNCGLW